MTSMYVTSGGLPTADYATVIDEMIRDAGIDSQVKGLDYATEYIPQLRDSPGQSAGWGYKSTAGGAGTFDAVSQASNFYWSKGGTTFYGYSTTGQNDQSGDPEVDRLIEKARAEFNTEARQALILDLQRTLAKGMYAIFPPGPGTGFDPAWPCVGNFAVWQGGLVNERLWIDPTKPPL